MRPVRRSPRMASQKSSTKASAHRKPKKDKEKDKKRKAAARTAAKPDRGHHSEKPSREDAARHEAKERREAKEKVDKLKAGRKGSGSVEEGDPEEQADELAAAVEVDPDAEEDELEDEALVERKEVKELLEAGRQKGFLTYDEVNDALPADIVSSDQIDDVMSMFGDNDIAIVDEANKVKLPDTKPPEPEPVHAKAAEEEAEEKKEQEEEDNYSKSNDPVRMYLRKMGS